MTASLTPKRVVVGIDFSADSARAAEWAEREAAERGMPLHLAHCLELPASTGLRDDFVRERRETAEEHLAALRMQIRGRHPELDVTTQIFDAHTAEQLIRLSETAALIVVGSRGGGGFAGLVLGSVSLSLVLHARCPVTVVRS